MAKINLTPKDIFEQEFKSSMRGYDKGEVDEFLDDVIKDYETYIALVKELQEENAKLRSRVQSNATVARPASRSVAGNETSRASSAATTATNYDILKRISRLEKEVFGKQIVE
ncbi:cell division regulator GpsB [Streptococcus dentiloxodontae]